MRLISNIFRPSHHMRVSPLERDETLPSDSDRETEFLIKEYEALRAEITSRIQSQTQLTTITILLLGGATAAAPLLISSGSQGLYPRLPLIYLVLLLLITSTLFTSLTLASMGHDIQMAYMAQYFHRNVRMRALSLSGETTVFNWDRYRIGLMFPTFKKSRPLLSTMAIAVLNTAQYQLMLTPAAISLLAAGIVYGVNFPIPPAEAIGWLDISLLFINSLYFLATIPCMLYIAHAYQEGPSDHPFL